MSSCRRGRRKRARTEESPLYALDATAAEAAEAAAGLSGEPTSHRKRVSGDQTTLDTCLRRPHDTGHSAIFCMLMPVFACCSILSLSKCATSLWQALVIRTQSSHFIPYRSRSRIFTLQIYKYVFQSFQYFRAQKRAQALKIQNRCSLLVGSSRFSTKFVECPVVDNVPEARC